MTQKHGRRQKEHCHLERELFSPSNTWLLLENDLRKISTGHYSLQCLISERDSLREWRVYICEAAGSAGKPTRFANSSHVQWNKLMASLVPDKKCSVRKAWMCFLSLSHTHGHTGAACLLHFLCILVYDLWVVEKKWYIILFLLSFLPGQQETLGDYICSQ